MAGLVDLRSTGLGWAGLGRGGEAVYTSQDEPALSEFLRRWPRKSLEASGRFLGQLALRMASLHSCHTCMKPSDRLGLVSPFMEP